MSNNTPVPPPSPDSQPGILRLASGSDWNDRSSRRKFLKRTGGATLATIIATLGFTRSTATAEVGGSGEDPGHTHSWVRHRWLDQDIWQIIDICSCGQQKIIDSGSHADPTPPGWSNLPWVPGFTPP